VDSLASMELSVPLVLPLVFSVCCELTNELINEIDDPEVTQTWNKYTDTARKAGFREGATDGRDHVFQKSFDEGYAEGFRNGFAIGKYKGAVRAKSNKNSQPDETDPNLEYSRRAWCQMCKNENLLQTTVNEIKQIQTQVSNNILGKLYAKYSDTTNVTLQNKLD